MRISTNQIFDSGSSSIQRGQSSLYKLQNQLSSGKRVLTPQDDPVAAAEALVVTQAKEVNAQYIENQGQAKSQLGLVDSQLSSIIDVLQNVRDKVIQAGNTKTLSNSDRQSIASEIESRLGEVLGIANSDNGVGEYLFSGYKGNVLPFAVDASKSAIAPAAISPVGFFGDSGERLLQVSSSRQMAVSVSGEELFMSVKNGNGTFVTATGGNVGVGVGVRDAASTAVADAGSIVDRSLWSAAQESAAAGQPLEIHFVDNAGTLSYQIYDPVGGSSAPVAYVAGNPIALVTAGGVNFGAQVVVNGVPVVGDSFMIDPGNNQGSCMIDSGSVRDPQKWMLAVDNAAAGSPLEIRFVDVGGVLNYAIYDPVGGTTSLQPYSSGQAMALKTANGVDFGAQVVLTGTPVAGDTFTVSASSNQSLFQTLQNILGVLRSPIGDSTYTATEYSIDLGTELTNIDQAINNISRVQSAVGTRMQEIESQGSVLSDLDIQYQAKLSDLQDLDYAEAISDFIKQQTNLEAAQKSFAQISGMSLFDYL